LKPSIATFKMRILARTYTLAVVVVFNKASERSKRTSNRERGDDGMNDDGWRWVAMCKRHKRANEKVRGNDLAAKSKLSRSAASLLTKLAFGFFLLVVLCVSSSSLLLLVLRSSLPPPSSRVVPWHLLARLRWRLPSCWRSCSLLSCQGTCC